MEDKDMIGAVEEYFLQNSFPPLGNALSARSSVRNEQVHKFIQDVLVEVNLKLWKLEQRVDKEYMKTEDFVNFLHKTLIKASLDIRQEKRKIFANIIVNSALKGNAGAENSRKYLYDETIDKIDERLFEFLLWLKSRTLTSNGVECDGWKGDEPELENWGLEEHFIDDAEYLIGAGLMSRVPKFNVDTESGDLTYTEEYFVTKYGLEFVEYVREQDAVEDATAEQM